MAVATLQFTSTQSANWTVSLPSGDANCHLNLDEGMETPNTDDYVASYDSATHGYWYLDDDVPEDVATITAVCVQFYHTGAVIIGPPTCLMTLYEAQEPSSPIQLAQKLINLETSGNTASQVVFDGLSLTRDQLLNLGVYWDMQPTGGGSGENPPEYEEGWSGSD